MAQKAVEYIARNTHLIDSKRLHSKLHTVERCCFPNIVCTEIVRAFSWDRLVIAFCAKFDSDLVGLIIWYLDHVSHTLPCRAELSGVFDTHLISDSKLHISQLKLW